MEDLKIIEYLRAIKNTVDAESDYYGIADSFYDEENLDVCYPLDYIVEQFCFADQCGGPLPPKVAEFIKAAYEEDIEENNSAESANNLGTLYYDGRIGEQNFTKAVEYYTKAASLGSRVAAENLGYCYYYGRNVDVDYEKAFHYFSLGAFDGHIISRYKIGDMYKNGYFVDKNEKEAFYIYKKCLKSLDNYKNKGSAADVYMRVADCYAKGIGTDVDELKAYKYVTKAIYGFMKRLNSGDFMIRGCYKHCVELEETLRKNIEEQFPNWKGF